jgi:hypothetical protein
MQNTILNFDHFPRFYLSPLKTFRVLLGGYINIGRIRSLNVFKPWILLMEGR